VFHLLLLGGPAPQPLAAGAAFSYPRRIDRPQECQPASGLLALLAMLYEDRVLTASSRRGLVSYRSILDSPFVQVPHAAMPPGVFRAGDLPDLVAALSPRAVNLESVVDGLNRQVSASDVKAAYDAATRSYGKTDHVSISD
jgi:hypothetical protein